RSLAGGSAAGAAARGRSPAGMTVRLRPVLLGAGALFFRRLTGDGRVEAFAADDCSHSAPACGDRPGMGSSPYRPRWATADAADMMVPVQPCLVHACERRTHPWSTCSSTVTPWPRR